MKKQVAWRTLNERQKYLLGRIPTKYYLTKRKHEPEPANVRIARRLIASYDKKQALLDCQHTKRMEALVEKAKESVYFHPEEEALQIVQQIEKLTRKCEI